MLKEWARRRHFRRVRSLLRACLAVTRDHRQQELFGYGQRVARASLDLPSNWLAGLAPGEMSGDAEWCLRQILWLYARRRLGALCELPRFVNGDVGPFFAPLPLAWRKVLKGFGMKLETGRSAGAFFGFQIEGFTSGLRRLGHYLRHARQFGRPSGSYGVLYFARSFNLPPRDCSPPHYDWATWTLQSGLVARETRLWAVSLSGGDVSRDHIEIVPNALPGLRSRWDMARFVLTAARIVVVTMLRWLTGTWWAPVMLREFIDLAYARCVAAGDFAVGYYFPPQFMSSRPLWSWWAERQGADAVLVFYSHNFQTTYLPGPPDLPLTDPTYGLMRWPKVVYLTDECGPYMEAVGAAPHKHVVLGPVTMVDQGGIPPATGRPAVAVFDMDPAPRVHRAVVGLPLNWHSTEIVRVFLDEVSAAIRESGAVPVWKLKGTIFEEDALDPSALRYDRVAHRAIARKHGVVVCKDSIPVHRLAGSVDAAIVLPFTTPATLFRQLGVAAAYYDPTGTLGGHVLMARGAQILTDRRVLRVWLRQVVDQALERRISA
jgi:hypothetical protein